jgi:hypothetical protein
MTRRTGTAFCVVVLLSACASHHAGLPSPAQPTSTLSAAQVSLPAVSGETKSASARYLAGPGALYVTFRDVSSPLLTLAAADHATAADVATCTDVGTRLTTSVNPGQLLTVAQQIPDQTLATLALDERSARADLLRACVAGRLPVELVRSVADANTLVNRRLEELK